MCALCVGGIAGATSTMMEDTQQLPNNKGIEPPIKPLLLPPQHLNVVGGVAASGELVSQSPLSDVGATRDDMDDEKCDFDPENSKKSCSDATPDTADDISFIDNQDVSDGPASEQSDKLNCDKRETASSSIVADSVVNKDKKAELDANKSIELSKAAFAFTIDFNDGKQIDSKKKNDIFERFQKRHKRGVSLSKLDDGSTKANNAPFGKSKPPLKRTGSKTLSVDRVETEEVTVTLRDKSRLCPRDLSNDHRHSWSPRTSMHATEALAIAAKGKSRPAAVLKMAFQDQSEYEPLAVALLAQHDDDTDLVLGNAPPLEYRKQSFDSDSSVSEAGTYTLDGDNYTEEQKALMSIDKLSKLTKEVAASTATDEVEVIDLECVETAETFERPKVKKHTSYLERIKSKVKTISERTFHKNRSPDKCMGVDMPLQPPKTLDLGNFTSITSSGVFSKKSVPQLPARMTARRKNSLTKSQIDSSEYIQKFDEKLLNSFTDYEKAQHNDYQLNIFAAQDCAAAERLRRCRDDKADSQLSSCSTSTTTASYGIETAETKNDWIQEWAKNARKNTRKPNSARASSERPSNRSSSNNGGDYSNQLQSHCGGGGVEEFGDNLDRNYSQRKKINRYDDTGNTSKGLEEQLFLRYEHRPQSALTFGRRRQVADMVSSSDFGDDLDDDVSLASSSVLKHNTTSAYETSNRLRREFFARPPISPTKIPSPMHSMTRPRSSSVNRSLHSSITVRIYLLE